MSPIPVALHPILFITIDDNIEEEMEKVLVFEMKNQHHRVHSTRSIIMCRSMEETFCRIYMFGIFSLFFVL